MSNFSCFVTGTDTDVGKTLISAALLHSLVQSGIRALGMKPVAAGCVDGVNADVQMLEQAGNVHLPLSARTLYLYDEFCAPHIAAERAGQEIDLSRICRAAHALRAQTQALVVEGVGGFCVPLNAAVDTADLAQDLGLPVVLVVGLRLGCINHALLTAQAIAARGLSLIGWVANTIDADMLYRTENIAALQARLAAPLLGVVPRLVNPSAAHCADYLDFSQLPAWPQRAPGTVNREEHHA